MPWSGSRYTAMAHAAWACTIGPQPPGEALAAAGWSRMESSTAPYTSFCRWSKAPCRCGTGWPRRSRRGRRGRLGQVAAPVDPVHDLQGAVLVGLHVGDELHELVGLPVQVEPVQRLQGEGAVAHPRVAVVPVAFPARRLGRGGEGRHRGPGRHVGEALDGQGGTLDRSRQRWSGKRPVPARSQNCVVAARRRLASSRSSGTARPSAHDSAHQSCSPSRRTCRALTRLASIPSSMLVRSRTVWPAPLASATCRPPSTSAQSARERP